MAEKLYGKWQTKNNPYQGGISIPTMRKAFEKAGIGVQKPTVIEVHPDNKKWRMRTANRQSDWDFMD